jgi:iron complex outermembrane receptor protein
VDRKSQALFGELYFKPVDAVELMGGVRWFDQEQDQYSNLIVPFLRSVAIGGAPGVQPSNPQSFDDVTFKGQITWKPLEHVLVYAQYAEGFRSGGVNAQITPNIPPSYEPDTATSTELGIKTNWMDRRLFANIYFYEFVWQNLQMGAAFTGQFNGMVNCTEQKDPAKSNGWEAEITFAATESITVGANYTGMDARWTVDPNTCLPPELVATLSDPIGGYDGQNLVGVPDDAGSAFVDVDFNWSDSITGFFRADVTYQGVVPVNQMRVDRNLPNPSFWLGNLRLGAAFDRYELALYVKNVTDEKAQLNLFNTFQQENRVTPAQPRTIGLTFTASFGER